MTQGEKDGQRRLPRPRFSAPLEHTGEIVRERSSGDPLLGPVDDPVLLVLSLRRRASKSRDVGSCERLRDGEGDELLSSEDGRDDFGLEFLRAEVEDGRELYTHAQGK